MAPGRGSLPGSVKSEYPTRGAAGRTDSAQTLQRDLVAVEELALIERKAEGVRARRELILAFLPWRRPTAKPKAGA
jgi:hypothetical protein